MRSADRVITMISFRQRARSVVVTQRANAGALGPSSAQLLPHLLEQCLKGVSKIGDALACVPPPPRAPRALRSRSPRRARVALVVRAARDAPAAYRDRDRAASRRLRSTDARSFARADAASSRPSSGARRHSLPASLIRRARARRRRHPPPPSARRGRRWDCSYLDGKLPLPYVHLLTLMAKFNVLRILRLRARNRPLLPRGGEDAHSS